MFAAWITFSAVRQDGVTTPRVEVLLRANDPLYEVGMSLGGHSQENAFWVATLHNLAARFGGRRRRRRRSRPASIAATVDDAANIRHNAAIRSGLYRMRHPRVWCATADSRDLAPNHGQPGRQRDPGRARCRRRRLRPQRAGRGHHAGSGGSVGRRLRSRRDHRRRDAQRGADAARLRPRRLLDHPGTSLASPFFRSLDLDALGVELLHPDAPLAHPLDDGRPPSSSGRWPRRRPASVPTTGGTGSSWRRWCATPTSSCRSCSGPSTAPASPTRRCPLRLPRPALGEGHGRRRSGATWRRRCSLGLSAHSMVPLDSPMTAAFGLVLAIAAHAYGWPVVRGGTQRPGRRAGRAPAVARRRDRHRQAGRSLDELPAAPARCSSTRRREAWRDRRRPAPDRLPTAARGLPLRPGHLQGRLGARRTDPVAGRRRRARRHGPPRRDAATRSRPPSDDVAQGRHPERPFVLARPAEPASTRAARPDGQAHRLGLLPRPQRLDTST